MRAAKNKKETFTSAEDRARKLRDTLARQAAELVRDKSLEPAVREAGLRAIQHAAECAGRLMLLAEQTSGAVRDSQDMVKE